MLFNRVYCPACGGKNCLPIAPYFEKGYGRPIIRLKVDKCLKCGIEMTGKDYMRLLTSLNKEIGAKE